MVEYAEITGIMATLFGLIISIIDRNLKKQFQIKNAFSPQTAITIEPSNRLIRRRFRRLQRAGIVRSSPANRYYFDENAWLSLRKTRRRRALLVVSIVVLLVLSIYLIMGK